MGLFDGFDPGAMSEFQVPDEERKRLLLANMLLGIAAPMMNAKKGQELGALGNGMLNGGVMAQQALSSAQQAQYDKLRAASGIMDFKTKKQAYEDEQATRNVAQNFYANAQPPALPDGAAGPPAEVPAPAGSKYAQYMALSQQLAAKGLVKQADALAQMAEKFKPEIKEQRTLTQNGKRVVVNVYKDGTTQVLPDVGPDMEKAHFGSTGKMVDIPLDPFTGQPRGTGMAAEMSPIQSDESKRGWANYGLAKNADQRAAEAAKRANEVKPQWDSTTGQFVYAPSPEAPTGVAVQPKGYVPKPPEHTRRELDSIDAQIGIVQGAKKAATETPGAFTMQRGMATEMGGVAESVAGRFDSPKESQARSYVFNVVSKVINERAGAAQSVQELARLRSFLPSPMDNEQQINNKLTAFEEYLKDQRKAYAGAGGKPNTVSFYSLPK